jgi:hypothetical protein
MQSAKTVSIKNKRNNDASAEAFTKQKIRRKK